MKISKIFQEFNQNNSNNILSTLIHIFYHIPNFRKKIFEYKTENNFLNNIKNSLLIYEENSKIKEKSKQKKINFEEIFNSFQTIFPNVNNEPDEIINNILSLIHKETNKNKNYTNVNNNSNNCNCISHSLFSLNLKDKEKCEKCQKEKFISFNKNYFIYDIFTFEILDEILNYDFKYLKNNFFYFAKKINNLTFNYSGNNNICKCKNFNVSKTLILYEKFPETFIINLEYDVFPSNWEICRIYNLISYSDNMSNIFELSNINEKNHNCFNLFAFITKNDKNEFNCAIKSKKYEKKWAFITNENQIYFDNFVKLKEHLILNYNFPVILFYSYLIKLENNEKFDFDKNEYDEIVKKCIKLEEKNKIKTKKSNPAIEEYKLAKGTPKDSLISLDSQEENFWICVFCKKKNDKDKFKCWCCERENKILPSPNKNKIDNKEILENIKQFNNKNNVINELSETIRPFGNLGNEYYQQTNENVDESEIRKDLKNLDIKKGFNEKDYKINNIQPEIDYTNNFDIKMAQTIWICRKCKKKNVERKCECGEKKEN
jgi:hypothetical protein